jgi:putative sigma-54 modulation protein
MELHFVGKHIDITDALKAHITDKLQPIEKRFSRITQIRITLHVDHLDQIAEGTVHLDGAEIHAAATTADMYLSVDAMIEKLLGQMTKHKEKIIDSHR